MTTTTAAPATLALSRDDLAALRTADSVVFESYVRAGKRLTRMRALCCKRLYDKSPIIFTTREQTLFPEPVDFAPDERMRAIPVRDSWHFHGEFGSDLERASGFELISSAQYHDTWATIARFLKVGDQLTLRWTANNDNGYTKDAGLNRDELHLVVRRGEEQRPLVFLLAVSVCASNSARMVKPC